MFWSKSLYPFQYLILKRNGLVYPYIHERSYNLLEVSDVTT